MEYTADRVENEITLLPSFLKMFLMFQMSFWYDKEPDDQNDVKYISIRCSNCAQETGLSMDNMNTNYKYTVTVFVSHTLLHHVGMSRIIETQEQLKYEMKKTQIGLYFVPGIAHIFEKNTWNSV